MYSLKMSHLIREKTDAEVYELYIDMRSAGKGYEEFYKRCMEEDVVFIRGKGSEVTTWPESPLADDAAMRLGMLRFEQGDRDAALRWFYFVVEKHADGEFADEARVRVATLEYGRGEHRAAREVLAQVRFSQLNRAQRRAAFRVLVSTAPDDVSALRWLAHLRAEEDDEDRVARGRHREAWISCSVSSANAVEMTGSPSSHRGLRSLCHEPSGRWRFSTAAARSSRQSRGPSGVSRRSIPVRRSAFAAVM